MAYDTSYYDEEIKRYNQFADQQAAQQIEQAQKAAQGQLRQAYAQRMQNQKSLNQNLAMSGIRGGATETSNLNLMNQYGQQRSQINSDLANSVLGINTATAENKFNNMMQTESARREYIENREAEDRANAREDKQIAYERKQLEEQQKEEKLTANYTAKYSKYFSEKKLKAALKKAKTPLEKRIINARIGYVKSVKKGGKWL